MSKLMTYESFRAAAEPPTGPTPRKPVTPGDGVITRLERSKGDDAYVPVTTTRRPRPSLMRALPRRRSR